VIDFLNQCGATEWNFFGCLLTPVSTGHHTLLQPHLIHGPLFEVQTPKS
jgi:hypothetical protein